jgi:hypothetical protein
VQADEEEDEFHSQGSAGHETQEEEKFPEMKEE